MAEKLEIIISAKDDASHALKGVNHALAGLGNAVGNIAKVGAIGAVAGIGALVAGIGASVKEAMASEEAMAQLNAVIKSTGGAAGITAEQANDLASSLQNVTRFSDETVLAAETMLLRFQGINKETFPQATALSLDLATALGVDAASAAKLLGKALEVPGEGLARLKAAGVSFTDAQTEMIKAMTEAGDIAGAQKFILDELEKSIGGAAKAAGDTFAGKLDILQNKFSDILETVGGAFLPMLTDVADGLIEFLTRPEVQAGLKSLAEGIANIARDIGTFVANLGSIDIGAALASLFGGGPEMAEGINKALSDVTSFVQTKISEIVTAIQEGNIGQALAAALLPTGVDMGGLGEIFSGILSGLQENFGKLTEWITGTLAPALTESFAQIAEAAMPTLLQMGEWIITNLLPALQELWNWLGPLLQESFETLGTLLTGTIIPAFTQFAVWIFSQGLPALGALVAQIGGALANIARDIGTFVTNLGSIDIGKILADLFGGGPEMAEGINKALSDVTSFVQTKISEIVTAIQEGNIGQALAAALLPTGVDMDGLGEIFSGILSGLQENFGKLTEWITGTLAPALTESFAQIAEAAMPTLLQMEEWITTNLLPALQELWNWLGPLLQESFAQIAEATLPTLLQMGEWIATNLLPVLQELWNWLGPLLQGAFATLGTLLTGTIIPAFTQFAVWIFSQGLPALGALAAQIGGAINTAIQGLTQLWRDLNDAVKRTGEFLAGVQKALEDIANVIMNVVGPAILWFIDNIIKPLAQAIAGILVKIHEFLSALREVGVALANLPGGIGGGSGGTEGKAEGGPVYPHNSYLVGERGPELFVPGRSGQIISNEDLRREVAPPAWYMEGGLVFNAPVTFLVPNRATWDSLMNDARLRALAARTT